MGYDVELLSSTRRVAESLWKHNRYVARPAREGLLVFEHRRGVVPQPRNVSRQKQHVFLGTLAANARIVATSHIASCSIVTPVDSRTARSSSSVMACASARATSKTNKLTFRGCRHIRIGSDSNPRLVCCQIRFERFYVVEYIVKVLYAFRVFISTK